MVNPGPNLEPNAAQLWTSRISPCSIYVNP